MERWIDTPKDVPFSYARGIWNRKDINREEYQALLEEIRSYPIAPINKAKISDFLWVVENDFSNTKIAETAYCEHLKITLSEKISQECIFEFTYKWKTK